MTLKSMNSLFSDEEEINELTSDEMAEVRLADLLGLQPRRGLSEEAQKYGRGDVVQDPRFLGEGGLREREEGRSETRRKLWGDEE